MNLITFTLVEVMGIIGGLISVFVIIFGFFVRRTVYEEIDNLKNNKQDNGFCLQQKALCNSELQSMCDDVKEIKGDLKEGRKEFSQINKKLERVMVSMRLKFEDLNMD